MRQAAVDEQAGWRRCRISGLETRLGVLSWVAPMLVISILAWLVLREADAWSVK